MAVEIPLNKGYVTIVDDEDADAVKQFKWRVFFMKCGVYAGRTARKDEPGPHSIYLARWLMKPPPGFQVDHRNRDTLDNRRGNLRIATWSQNQANAPAQTGRFKGVDFHKSRNKWRARMMVDGKVHFIGRFPTEEEAALAYDKVALEVFGEFALLNFPREA